jgi:hypothetical protein
VLMATNRYRFLSWWDIYRDQKCFENWTLPTSYFQSKGKYCISDFVDIQWF